MKLTGLLKDKVDAVDTREEKKAIIAEAGMELTDDELDGVAGGSIYMPINLTCHYCGWVNVVQLGMNKYTCGNCGKTTEVMG